MVVNIIDFLGLDVKFQIIDVLGINLVVNLFNELDLFGIFLKVIIEFGFIDLMIRFFFLGIV